MKDQIGNVKTNNYMPDEQYHRMLAQQMANLYVPGLLKDHPCGRPRARHFDVTAVCDRMVTRSPSNLFIHYGSDCGAPLQSKVTTNPSIRKPETGTPEAVCTEYLLLQPCS